MKQVLQNLKSGRIGVDDIPRPLLRDEGLLVRTRASLISAGTERMMLKLGQKSLVGKARERPDLVRRVLDKVRRDGFWTTFHAVRQQLDREVPLGYSICGKVLETGPLAADFPLGSLVACAGAGYANHAEINYVPRLLAAPVPGGVSEEQAAYATVGAIALQGIRNAQVRVGEVVVVIGLGLVGQLAVQQLHAAGCRVVGLDRDHARVALAGRSGADLALAADDARLTDQVRDFSRGRGADAILITAATSSNEPIEMAAELARDRARVVMVGVTGMDIPRASYYMKELTFIVSRSYGPGRYDSQYEQHGRDYPAGYVRWTENRNIEAFLDMVAAGTVQPEICTTHRFPIAEALSAFELILENSAPHLGVLLTYPAEENVAATAGRDRIVLRPASAKQERARLGVSFLGAGSFARSVLLPNIAGDARVQLRGVVTSSGISAQTAGKKYGFAFCASAEDEIMSDPETDVVCIATRHSQHAGSVCRALRAGKAVFTEKPLAIAPDQLRSVEEALAESSAPLLVGFNRRFAPLARDLKAHFRDCGPLAVQYRCNAGPMPPDHWLADPAEGGRIVGEACHFLDFFAYLTDGRPERVYALSPRGSSADDAAITVDYTDGSVCQLIYATTGPPSFSKERIEVYAGGRVGVLEDFKTLMMQAGTRRPQKRRLGRADKGHAAGLQEFFSAIRSGAAAPIAADSLCDTTWASFAVLASLRSGQPVSVDEVRADRQESAG